MQSFVLSLHMILAVALVIIVLLQRSEGGALGIGGGGGGLFNVRSSGDILTRITAILAASFMATSLILTVLSGSHDRAESIFDQDGEKNATETELPLDNLDNVPLPAEPTPQDGVPLAQ